MPKCAALAPHIVPGVAREQWYAPCRRTGSQSQSTRPGLRGTVFKGLCICFREPTWDLDAQTSHLSLGGVALLSAVYPVCPD